jgi:4-aminobutyrate aminotransferase
MPMAAIIAQSALDCAPEAALGHYTHEKSPVGSAAALATLDVIEEEGLVARAREFGRIGLERLDALKARRPEIRDVRGIGAYFGVELGGEPGEANARAERILYACVKRGLSFKLGGGNVVTPCPPLTIPLDQFHAAFDILEQSFDAVAA